MRDKGFTPRLCEICRTGVVYVTNWLASAGLWLTIAEEIASVVFD